MTALAGMAVAALVGIAVGLVFFTGLSVTVSLGLKSKLPFLWFPLSFLVRAGIALGGFYWVGAGRLDRLLACLAGFVAVRMAMSRFGPFRQTGGGPS